jgi:CDP-diacylglycerol--glycerol-3-phosphate 3-phosphatidyltransferase
VVAGLARLGVTPTAVTMVGLLLNIAAGVAAGYGRAFEAGLVLIVAGICDALDGQLARRTGRVSRFGAFLDSTIDRIDESAVLCGIAAWFLRRGGPTDDLMAVACMAALAGSIITSYTRARAEGLGLECKVGVFERPERVVVTIAGLLFGPSVLTGAILIVVVLSWLTVLQRIAHVRRLVQEQEQAGGAAPEPLPPGGRPGTRAGTRTLKVG